MRTIGVVIIIIIAFLGVAASSEESINCFTKEIIASIKNDDLEKFNKYFLSGGGPLSEEDDQFEYIFGSEGSERSIRSFLTGAKDLRILHYPFSGQDIGDSKSYLVLIYDPHVIDLERSHNVDTYEKYIDIGFVETLAFHTRDGWKLVDSAFYYGTAHSWVEDY